MSFSPSLPCILHTATKSSERRCEFCLFISVISIIVLAIYYHRFFLTKYQRDTAQKSNYGYSSPPVSPQARDAAWCSTQEPKMPRVITSCYTHKQTVTELTLQLWSWSISSSASNLQYWLNRNSSVPEHRCFCTLSNFHHSMKAAFSFLDRGNMAMEPSNISHTRRLKKKLPTLALHYIQVTNNFFDLCWSSERQQCTSTMQTCKTHPFCDRENNPLITRDLWSSKKV